MTRTAMIGSKLFGIVFAGSAVAKIVTFSKQRALMEAAGLPLAPFGLVLAMGVEAGSAAAALAGYRPGLAAKVMIGYIAVVTAALPARTLDDDVVGPVSKALLISNTAMMLALTYVATSYGSGRESR